MSIFSNKHILAALIVSPILALITYFAIDYVVKEKPQVAQAGQSYPLVAKSNCRYSSGQCNLENSDFKASLKVEQVDGQSSLSLDVNHPLDGVMIGLAQQGDDIEKVTPIAMLNQNETRQSWTLPLNFDVDENTTLAIAISVNGSQYFGETQMAFSKYEAIFQEDFRREKQ